MPAIFSFIILLSFCLLLLALLSALLFCLYFCVDFFFLHLCHFCCTMLGSLWMYETYQFSSLPLSSTPLQSQLFRDYFLLYFTAFFIFGFVARQQTKEWAWHVNVCTNLCLRTLCDHFSLVFFLVYYFPFTFIPLLVAQSSTVVFVSSVHCISVVFSRFYQFIVPWFIIVMLKFFVCLLLFFLLCYYGFFVIFSVFRLLDFFWRLPLISSLLIFLFEKNISNIVENE